MKRNEKPKSRKQTQVSRKKTKRHNSEAQRTRFRVVLFSSPSSRHHFQATSFKLVELGDLRRGCEEAGAKKRIDAKKRVRETSM